MNQVSDTSYPPRTAYTGARETALDTKELLEALRDETLPRVSAAREALGHAWDSGDVAGLKVVRELFHRVAGTAAVAGLPGLSRYARLGEELAVLGIEGEAKVGPRLCNALGLVITAIEQDLAAGEGTAKLPPAPAAGAPAPHASEHGKGRVAVASDEAVSAKLLVRVLEDAGFDVHRTSLAGAVEAAPDCDVLLLDVPAADSALPHLDAALTAAGKSRLPVMLTGKPDAGGDKLKALATKASTFVPKPVVPETLVTTARTLAARRRAAVAARARAPTAQMPSPVRPAHPLKVLIVDDSRVIRGVVREALTEVGLVPVEAEDGTEALKIFDAEAPDAVISDVQMPGLDGAQLTRVLRERSPDKHIPIVVLSALDDEKSRQAGLAAGADAYLVKSVIDGPALLEALKAAGLPIG